MESWKNKEERRLRIIDQLNYELGYYIMFAVNDPKKYPKKPFRAKEQVRVMSGEEMERIARANTIKLGGNIINGSNNS